MKKGSRVKEHRRVAANTLIPHPQNWRIHSAEQESAMREIVDRLGGMAGSVHAYESARYGGLTLIDGHMRRQLAGTGEIDVEVLDVNDDEADLLLATFDPVSDMAGRDEEMLGALIAKLDLSGIDDMFRDMQRIGLVDLAADDEDLGGDPTESGPKYPLVAHFDEGYDYVIVFCRKQTEFAMLQTYLELPVEEYRAGKLGMSQVLEFKEFEKRWKRR